MIVDGIEFNYTVKAVDIETAHMIVEYTPVDQDLIPTTLNVPFVELRQWTLNPQTNEQVPLDTNIPFEEHKKYSIKVAAPASLWRRQKLLINNIA